MLDDCSVAESEDDVVSGRKVSLAEGIVGGHGCKAGQETSRKSSSSAGVASEDQPCWPAEVTLVGEEKMDEAIASSGGWHGGHDPH